MVVVIIEGPDSSGKSTLIAHLQEHFGDQLTLAEGSHQGPHRNDPSFRTEEAVRGRVYGAIIHDVLTIEKPQIHDRLFFSELVYGQVLRGEVCFNYKEQQHICRLLTALSPPIIFCLPPLEAIHAKIYGHDHMEGVTSRVDAIYGTYLALSGLKRPSIILYDYTKGPAAKQKVVKAVTAYMERRSKRGPWQPTSSTSST